MPSCASLLGVPPCCCAGHAAGDAARAYACARRRRRRVSRCLRSSLLRSCLRSRAPPRRNRLLACRLLVQHEVLVDFADIGAARSARGPRPSPPPGCSFGSSSAVRHVARPGAGSRGSWWRTNSSTDRRDRQVAVAGPSPSLRPRRRHRCLVRRIDAAQAGGRRAADRPGRDEAAASSIRSAGRSALSARRASSRCACSAAASWLMPRAPA